MQKRFHLVYKTTITPFFPICLIGKSYSGRFEKLVKLNLKPKKVIVLISDGVVNWFFDKSQKENAQKIFAKVLSSPKYLQKIKSEEKEISRGILKEIKTPIGKLFSRKILNKKGEEKLKRIFDYYANYGRMIDDPGFLFQLYICDEIKKEIFQRIKKSDEEKNEIFNFLLSSYQKTNYEKFLFALSENFKKEKNLKNLAKKFYWLIHDYVGEIIDECYIKNKIREFKKDRREFNLHLRGALQRIEKIKKIKKELPLDLLKKINIIEEILYLYNERKKEVLSQVNIYLRKIVEHKFPKISLEEIRVFYQITPDEIVDLLKDKKVENLEKRNKRWVYLIENEVIKNGPLKYFSLFISQKEAEILKGIPASPGLAKGRVNLVLNISHIYKFKKDEILVTPFTNVNYLPIMSKAKAILTETGGLTSHAAIVSRELKKPCIVGIKDLFLVLKDGQLVEVDANRGVVKILK